MDKICIDKIELPTLIASSRDEQYKGLMFKHEPTIMTFLFKKAEVRKFWMKNTNFPLDIIFCNAGKIIGIYKGSPLSMDRIGPNQASDLVIELPFGSVLNLGITIGQEVKLKCSLQTLAERFSNDLKYLPYG